MFIKQKFFITFVSSALCVFFSGILYAETLMYKETTSGNDIDIKITINKLENEYLVKTSSVVNNDEMIYNTDLSLSVIRWKYYKPDNGTDVILARSGKSISIMGRHKNKKIENKIEVDDLPWYEACFLGMGFKDFIASEKNTIDFLAMNPEDLKIYKYELKKERTETIEINGQKVESVYAKISLTGFLKLFWSGEMWFRKSDGVFILSKMTKGPGAPVSTMKLIEEI